MNFYGRMPVGFSGGLSLIPELAGLGLSFVLPLCMSLGFDCCWVFPLWVLPSCWFIEGHSVHHILYSIVQVWTGCVEADSSLCTRF